MTYAWFMGRLPSQDDKGGYTKDRFEMDLEAPMPTRPGQAPAEVDSGVSSLTQFMV